VLKQIGDLGNQFITLTQGPMKKTIITSAGLVPSLARHQPGRGGVDLQRVHHRPDA
jgi:hypothetical protein